MNPVTHLLETKPSYIREILNLVSNNEIISLAGGLPCPDHFPMGMIEPLMQDIAKDKSLFQYSTTAGYPPLIEGLRDRYHLGDDHEVIITNGSQQGIDLCARVFLNKGDKVVVESPSYLGALQIFSIAQAQIKTVTQEQDGPNVEQLENHFSKGDIRFFYGIPDFHNPTGCCWSLEKRQQVAALCIRYNVVFIEDAPYREIRFTGKSLPLVSEFCPEQAILLYSFSKMISPGLRIGALILPKRWMTAFSTLKQATDLHTAVPTQQLILSILQHPGFSEHLNQTNTSYHLRYQSLQAALSVLPKDKFTHNTVNGGMFIWLKIPETDTLAVAKKAIENGVAVVPSVEFYSPQAKPCSALRLNFSYNSPSKIKEGVQRLLPVLTEKL